MIKKLTFIALLLLCIGIIGSIFTINTQIKEVKKLEEKTMDEIDFTTIDIYTNNAEITLLPTTDRKATVELFGNDLNYNLITEMEGDTLKVGVKTKKNKIYSIHIFPKSLSLTLYIPVKSYEKVNIKSNNGQINVSKIESNNFQVETDNGNVQMNEIKGKTLDIETNNGAIELNEVVAETLKAETDNGRIKMDRVEGDIIGKTHNGRIFLKTDDLNHPVQLHSYNGRIEIMSKNKPTNAVLDLKTHNGKIRVFESSEWDTVIGNGDNLIKLTTNNGDIKISD